MQKCKCVYSPPPPAASAIALALALATALDDCASVDRNCTVSLTLIYNYCYNLRPDFEHCQVI